MGIISDIAAMQLKGSDEVANRGESGTMPMVIEHNIKKQFRTSAKSIGKNTGICDEENDWLSRQLKEEDEVLRRINAEYGGKGTIR